MITFFSLHTRNRSAPAPLTSRLHAAHKPAPVLSKTWPNLARCSPNILQGIHDIAQTIAVAIPTTCATNNNDHIISNARRDHRHAQPLLRAPAPHAHATCGPVVIHATPSPARMPVTRMTGTFKVKGRCTHQRRRSHGQARAYKHAPLLWRGGTAAEFAASARARVRRPRLSLSGARGV